MEEFKIVFGKYEVSNLGNVRNSKNNNILKPTKDRYGYYYVCLFEDGKRYYKKVHRLVAEAFIPNPENKPYIDHIDSNRTNNVYSNLRWTTPKENSNNPLTLNKIRMNCKPPEPNKKKVICLETKIEYASTKEAGKQNDVDPSCITKCCRGKRHTAGGYHWDYKD